MTAPFIRQSWVIQDGSFHGQISVYDYGRRLWTETSPTARLNVADAMADARAMAVEVLDENGLSKHK